MPYVKLDCGMLDSTIWIQREARELFITALLMAKPRDFAEPVPTIQIRTLEPAEFIIPPGDQYGFVGAASHGIIRRACLEMEAGLLGLESLASPEAESRTPDFDGRRMVRIDGGFVILNFKKYRIVDATAAQRSKRYRERVARDAADMAESILREHHTVSLQANAVTGRIVTEGVRIKDEVVKQDQKKELSPKRNGSSAPVPFEEIVGIFHEVLPELPKCTRVTDGRRGAIRARWHNELPTLEDWRNYFTYVRGSKFLMGQVQSKDRAPFRCSIDFLINPTNLAKIEGGTYQ